jgi:ribose 5-phosphate isomerase A
VVLAGGALKPEEASARDRVAREAAGLVESGMAVGLGSGDTARRFVSCLAERCRSEHLRIECVATSQATAVLAHSLGLTVRPLTEVRRLHLAADGADEVDPTKNLIKGGGGAHTREKIVAASADRFIVVVDENKLVDRLGERCPVPVEVVPEAVPLALDRIAVLGGRPLVRLGPDGRTPWRSELGNFVVDARFPEIVDPAGLESALRRIPGTLENGLFIGLATLVLVGRLADETTLSLT